MTKELTTTKPRTRPSDYVRITDKKYKFPTGRPSTYKPEMCQSVIDVMSAGDSYTYWCSMNGTTRERADSWQSKHQEFRDACKIAKQLCEAFWEKIGAERVKNNEHVKNEGLYKYFMGHRFGWKNTIDVTSQNMNLNVNVDADIENVKLLSQEIKVGDY